MHKSRLAFIGCGSWARKKYLGYLQNSAKTEVVAFAQIEHPEEVRELSTMFPSARFFATAEEMFSTLKIDGCLISLPHKLIGPALRTAVSHGSHVFTDKPFTTSTAEGVSVLELAKKNKVRVGVSHQRRAFASVEALQHEISLTSAKEIKWIHAAFYLNSYPDWTKGWRNDPSFSGQKELRQGILLDAGYHTLDSILFLLDFELPTEVYCIGAYREANVETDVTLTMVFSGDRHVSVQISRDLPATYEQEMVEVLSKHWYGKSMIEKSDSIETSALQLHKEDHSVEVIPFSPKAAAIKPIEAFVNFLHGDAFDERWSASTAITTLRVIDALYESLVHHTVVKL